MNLKRYLAAMLLMMSLAAAPLVVHALDLNEAKQRGLGGEMATGYIGAVKGATSDVASLIRSINGKRRDKYEKIAQGHKVSVTDVEVLAGKKAIEKTPRGQFVNTGSGWKKK